MLEFNSTPNKLIDGTCTHHLFIINWLFSFVFYHIYGEWLTLILEDFPISLSITHSSPSFLRPFTIRYSISNKSPSG